MSNHIKTLRGQLRQIVLDVLPDVLTQALVKDIEARLKKEMTDRLDAIDERQKAIQGYMVRQSTPTFIKET